VGRQRGLLSTHRQRAQQRRVVHDQLWVAQAPSVIKWGPHWNPGADDQAEARGVRATAPPGHAVRIWRLLTNEGIDVAIDDRHKLQRAVRELFMQDWGVDVELVFPDCHGAAVTKRTVMQDLLFPVPVSCKKPEKN